VRGGKQPGKLIARQQVKYSFALSLVRCDIFDYAILRQGNLQELVELKLAPPPYNPKLVSLSLELSTMKPPPPDGRIPCPHTRSTQYKRE
jgi:hypothetical protein